MSSTVLLATQLRGVTPREQNWVMENYEPILSFGEDTAEIYDEAPRGDEMAAVAFLEELAGGGPALELAIGTGRIALPLAARGIQVDGIDLSPAMVARLRAKPGGEGLSVTMGDFAEMPVPGSYRLIFVVFNSLFNLLTQDDQVRCFEHVAAHLTADGSFVVEAFVPTYLTRLRTDQYVDAEAIGVDEVTLDVGRHDPVTQRLEESHVVLSREGVRLYPIVTRYAWPSELDLMARLAGLRLKERWGGWSREPFTADSSLHVSVYGR
jgi:SAM-dependent methyltransferase